MSWALRGVSVVTPTVVRGQERGRGSREGLLVVLRREEVEEGCRKMPGGCEGLGRVCLLVLCCVSC
jgi:hypothetical protein